MDNKEGNAEKLYIKAVDLAFSHDQPKALELINQALSLMPTSAKYAVEKAEILCELGKYQDALTFLAGLAPSDLITNEMKKIRDEIAADQIAPKDASAHEKLDRLMKWGKENGVDTANIKVVYYGPDFRGVHAARRIRKGERIIVVPEKAFVTLTRIVESCPLANKVANCGIELGYPFATALACMVYEMKNKSGSWWQPYAETFPEDAATYPYFFSPAELEYFKGTIGESNLIEEKNQSATEFNDLCEKVPELKKMTAHVYLKLTTLACSRYFAIETMPDGKLAVPIVDMFNYYVDKVGQTRWDYLAEEDVFCVAAMKDIQRGEIIGLNYGNKSNVKYLQYYGFIPENNTWMSLCIMPLMSETDPLLKEKQALLGYTNDEMYLFAKDFYTCCKENSKSNEKVMSAFRFAAYNGDIKILKKHVDNIKCDPDLKYKKLHIPPLSVENEINALKLLKENAIGRLKEYPNTCEKDEEILKTKKDLTENARNALTVRIGEQKAYKQIIEFADRMTLLLRKEHAEVQKEVISMPDSLWYKSYAKNILLPLLHK